ncbi:hypothetical protein BJX61DRAFT_545006 [Aspergillus egyptiacus]|nr:hypothetical protein BJX61DRAFT_545006 [Aspergillus egyptiacus]
MEKRPAKEVVERILDDLKAQANIIRAHLRKAELDPPKEKLLVRFHKEARRAVCQEPWAMTIPEPSAGTFQRSTYRKDYQLATLVDLTLKAVRAWPNGNRGLIPGRIHVNEDLKHYPWGLPAYKLAEEMTKQGLGRTFFDADVREFLIHVELWYFGTGYLGRTRLQTLDIQEWPLPEALAKQLGGILARGDIPARVERIAEENMQRIMKLNLEEESEEDSDPDFEEDSDSEESVDDLEYDSAEDVDNELKDDFKDGFEDDLNDEMDTD